MANVYDVGDLVRSRGVFTNAAGVLIDPDKVFFEVRSPGGVITTYEYTVNEELKRTDTGDYYVDINADMGGDFWYRFFSTDGGQAAGETFFRVRASRFA